MVLKKRLRIIYLINNRNACYLNTTHKFRIEVTESVAQAYALDKNNGNTLWLDVISKEMKDVSPAFSKVDNREIVLIGYQRVKCHMIFEFRMEYFRWKSKLVAVGHVT